MSYLNNYNQLILIVNSKDSKKDKGAKIKALNGSDNNIEKVIAKFEFNKTGDDLEGNNKIRLLNAFKRMRFIQTLNRISKGAVKKIQEEANAMKSSKKKIKTLPGIKTELREKLYELSELDPYTNDI